MLSASLNKTFPSFLIVLEESAENAQQTGQGPASSGDTLLAGVELDDERGGGDRQLTEEAAMEEQDNEQTTEEEGKTGTRCSTT